MSELTKRILTALFGVPLILSLIIWSDLGTRIVAFVISLGMLYEYTSITLSESHKVRKQLFLGLIFLFVSLWDAFSASLPFSHLELIAFLFVILSSYFLFSASRYDTKPEQFLLHIRELLFSFFGIFYAVVLLLFLPKLRALDHGLVLLFINFFVIWGADVGAYFAGKAFGKRKLYEAVSPKKTVEGAIGGALLAIVLGCVIAHFYLPGVSLTGVAAVCLTVSVVSVIGDLFESMLKRGFEVKDSSTLLPGHGGFLDRFDSLVFALPIMYSLSKAFLQ